MFKRQRTGSVVCASCGSLVGVNDERCYTCGRRNPGLWGFGPALRRFGNDLGFITLVIWGCSALYAVMLVVTVMFGGFAQGASGTSTDTWEFDGTGWRKAATTLVPPTMVFPSLVQFTSVIHNPSSPL